MGAAQAVLMNSRGLFITDYALLAQLRKAARRRNAKEALDHVGVGGRCD